MNGDIQFTDEQLRLAASRSLPPGSELDAETAALREGFLALGEAIEANTLKFDEAALLGRLKAVCQEPDRIALADSRRPKHALWQIVLSGALAAAALFAVARISIQWRQAETIALAPAIGTGLGNSNWATTNEHLVNSILWQDPLDEQIALAQAQIEWLGSRGRGVDGSLLDMNEQLRALSQELLGESL